VERFKQKHETMEDLVEKVIEPEMAFTKPQDFTPEETLYDNLMLEIRKYRPDEDLSGVEKAYQIAKEAHINQLRKSGEPYIIHPLNVAIILAELELDLETIEAGLLHDVIEDTVMTYDGVKETFGEEVANIVEGVTKVTQINWSVEKEDQEAENLRKMFMAMAKDIRVILVKLADRLHNMRTYQFWSRETQLRKAKETMEIFSPVASRLGISRMKVELDDRALAILHPEVFQDLTKRMAYSESDREQFIQDRIDEIRDRLEKENVKAEVVGRVKHLFSIYKKMTKQNKTLDQIYDVFAIRLIVDNVIDCYSALGVVHEMYTPLPGRFKDYIAMPKQNMYQSLHTTVINTSGVPFEIQIRTKEMHRIAEYGIAAHWKYKESGSVEAGKSQDEVKLAWLRSIMDWTNTDSREFVHLLKDDFDLFAGQVYCFTPTGAVKQLPAGSTPVDFAYAIHSAVGNKMVGAKVNGQLVPIEYQLQSGDRVEILTSQNSKGPSMDWLKIVKSSQARNKINQWYKAQNKEDNIKRGQDLIAAYCKTKNLVLSDLMQDKYVNPTLEKYHYSDWESLMSTVGRGGIKESQIVNKLIDEQKKEHEKNITDEDILREIGEKSPVRMEKPTNGHGIVVKGLHDLSVHFSKCCNPVPGDEIIGYITRGRGVSVHRTDCPNVLALPDTERARMVPADWSGAMGEENQGRYETQIQIFCHNRIGLFADISRIMTEDGIDIMSAQSRVNKQGIATIEMSFQVQNIEEVRRLTSHLMNVSGVIDIVRAAG